MLKNLVGIVTGGASGLGRGAASRLVNEGCKVTICDLPNSKGSEVAQELGPEVNFSPTDVRSQDEVNAMMEAVVRKYDKLDFVVNCAGLACAHKIYNFYINKPCIMERFEQVIDTNLKGTYNVVRMAVGYMAKNVPDKDGLRGVIINTAGMEAFDGQTGQSGIAAASGAIVSMTLPLARDLSERGIRVMCICPGVMQTPLTDGLPDKIKEHIEQSCTLPKRFGTPEEFGHAVQFILENRYVNGTYIRLDAGMRLFFL